MTQPVTGDRAFRVLVDGKDFTELVTSLNNSFLLDELERSSSMELRSSETKENQQLLAEFFNYSNRFAPVKIFTRGYYSDRENLRMSGYLTHISGSSIFTGLTATIKMTSPAADTAGNPTGPGAGAVVTGKTVTELVKHIIKEGGLTAGKIDDFPIIYGSWYPGNRSVFEQLYVLADSVGAYVNIRPPVSKVENGAIKINGLFELPKDGPTDDIKLKESLFALQSGGGGGFSLESQEITEDYIKKEGLVPTPTDMEAQQPYYGPGQRKTPNAEDPRNGFYYSADTQYKSKTQRDFEELQKKNIDPKIQKMISDAGVTAYYDPEEKVFVHAVKMRDNSGREITVPIDAAAASLKADMVIDFIDSDESKGMLGPSGLTLTLKEVQFGYPILRARDISGFEYNVPSTSRQGAMATTPSISNPFGAASKNYRVEQVKVKPTETVSDVAKKVENLGLFRSVDYKGADGQIQKFYIAYDPELIVKDKKTGEIDPILRIEDQNLTEAEKRATKQELVPLTREEFDKLTPGQIYSLYQKRRADALASGEDIFLKQFYPDIAKAQQDYIDGKSKDDSFRTRRDQVIEWETANNLYANSGVGDNIIYKKRDTAPYAVPVFTGAESISNFISPSSNGKEISLYVGGEEDKSSTKEGHGKTPTFRAQSLTFNPATGNNLQGTEVVQKNEWPFSFSVTIDSAVELTPGMTINCDETFGPLMGPYTIGSIEESISSESQRMSIELRTQAYMDGLGRAMNSREDTGSDLGETDLGAFGGTAQPPVAAPPRAKGSKSGLALATTARLSLRSSTTTPERGTCSAFVRAVVENHYGLRSTPLEGGALSDILFGASAVVTGRLMRKEGLVTDFNANGGLAGLRAGDILLQEYDSKGYGHIGIVGEDGSVTYENSWSLPGPDYRGTRTTQKFGRITGVVRSEDLDAWMKQRGYAK